MKGHVQGLSHMSLVCETELIYSHSPFSFADHWTTFYFPYWISWILLQIGIQAGYKCMDSSTAISRSLARFGHRITTKARRRSLHANLAAWSVLSMYPVDSHWMFLLWDVCIRCMGPRLHRCAGWVWSNWDQLHKYFSHILDIYCVPHPVGRQRGALLFLLCCRSY